MYGELSRLAAGSTASGVGIELRRADDANVANGALSARYVRTTDPLASGLFKLTLGRPPPAIPYVPLF